MKKTAAVLMAAAALALVPASASADSQSCFGQAAAAAAQANGGNGAFVSGAATSPEFKGSGNLTIGQEGVPFQKALACGP